MEFSKIISWNFLENFDGIFTRNAWIFFRRMSCFDEIDLEKCQKVYKQKPQI